MNNLGIAYFLYLQFGRAEKWFADTTKKELDDKMYTSVCVYHKNKWVSPQIAMKILGERPDRKSLSICLYTYFSGISYVLLDDLYTF